MPSITNAVFCTLAIAALTATRIAAFSLSTPSTTTTATTSLLVVTDQTTKSRLTKTLLWAGANGDARARTTTTTAAVAAAANKQSQYGVSLEYPSTYVRCGKCGSIYAIEQADLGDRGRGRYVTSLFGARVCVCVFFFLTLSLSRVCRLVGICAQKQSYGV